ncbi:MAG: rhodanese-like domain-containing protein [Rhodospirillales bacterium]|nr:rhodanese-like domain-containing protein [Rhodospirillales bacterium]
MSQYLEVDPATAHQWAADGQAVIVDVREHNELAQASVSGAVHVPMSAFDPAQLPTDSGKKIVFICAHGMRSVQVSQYLIANDILSEAYNLTGGLAAWLQAGLPVEPAIA